MLEYFIIGGIIAGLGWLYSKDMLPGQKAATIPGHPNAAVPPASAGAPAIPGFPDGATLVTPDGNHTGVLIGPPLPSLPPVAPGTLPALPSPTKAVEVLYPFLPPELRGGIVPVSNPIVPGDVVEVDLMTAGFLIPQNFPMVGHVFMEVVALNVPGDHYVPPKRLLAQFAVPELRVMGPQAVNREAIIRKVIPAGG